MKTSFKNSFYYYSNLSLGGACVLFASGIFAIIFSSLDSLYVVTSLTLFALGFVTSLKAFAISITRSRHEIITTSHLIVLPKQTETRIKVGLYGSLLVQITVSITFAATQSSTNFAFGILASVFALGNLNMWAILNGTFHKR